MLYAETSNRLSLKTREHLTTAVLQSSVVLHLLLGHLTYKQDPKRTPTKCQMQVRCGLISYLLVWHNYLQGKENCIYSQVHKYWDIDTILTFLALYTTTMDFKWNEQDVL